MITHRESVLEAMEGIDQGAGSAEAVSDDAFFPGFYAVPGQARTFELDRILIIGGRGTGKTQVFRALLDSKGREAIVRATGVRLVHDVSKMVLVEGFAAGRSFRPNAPPHPAADAIEGALANADVGTARKLWLGLSLARLSVDPASADVLGKTLGAQLSELREKVTSPRAILTWVDQDIERPFALLDAIDTSVSRHGMACVFTFDALDRAANGWATLEVVVGGLLSLALDVTRRNRSVRLKVFLRPDLEEGGTRSFPDASKLRGYREELTWEIPDLYRLAFKRMSGQPFGQAIRALLESHASPDAFQDLPPLGFTPTAAFDESAQTKVMTALVGKYMGANPQKGHTYNWIPNHLADALRRVAPRSFLVAFAEAARWMRTGATSEKSSAVLSPAALAEGVRAASTQRVEELAEDFPWVKEVAARLKELEVPATETQVIERLRECRFPDAQRARLRSAEPEPVLEHLVELGVFLRDRDGRYNVPDLYRVAMGMKRRGGIKLAS